MDSVSDTILLKSSLRRVATVAPSKLCEVCGGSVEAIDEKSFFGYCTKCGVVYALKERMGDARHLSNQAPPVRPDRESPPPQTPQKEEGAVWVCPDCGMEVPMTSQDDLKFVKRQHNLDYHPNRPA